VWVCRSSSLVLSVQFVGHWPFVPCVVRLMVNITNGVLTLRLPVSTGGLTRSWYSISQKLRSLGMCNESMA